MDLIMEAQNMESNSDQYIIYETFVSPNLKDKELQKEFECTEPTDIVNKIFKIGEIAILVGQLWNVLDLIEMLNISYMKN